MALLCGAQGPAAARLRTAGFRRQRLAARARNVRPRPRSAPTSAPIQPATKNSACARTSTLVRASQGPAAAHRPRRPRHRLAQRHADRAGPALRRGFAVHHHGRWPRCLATRRQRARGALHEHRWRADVRPQHGRAADAAARRAHAEDLHRVLREERELCDRVHGELFAGFRPPPMLLQGELEANGCSVRMPPGDLRELGWYSRWTCVVVCRAPRSQDACRRPAPRRPAGEGARHRGRCRRLADGRGHREEPRRAGPARRFEALRRTLRAAARLVWL